jgi:PleD family two-component response regulator
MRTDLLHEKQHRAMTKNDHLLSARMLMVDDQEVNLRLLEVILRREGFTHIRSIADPYSVLLAYVAYQPDSILLDLLMPDLDGFAIIELLRRRTPTGAFLRAAAPATIPRGRGPCAGAHRG